MMHIEHSKKGLNQYSKWYEHHQLPPHHDSLCSSSLSVQIILVIKWDSISALEQGDCLSHHHTFISFIFLTMNHVVVNKTDQNIRSEPNLSLLKKTTFSLGKIRLQWAFAENSLHLIQWNFETDGWFGVGRILKRDQLHCFRILSLESLVSFRWFPMNLTIDSRQFKCKGFVSSWKIFSLHFVGYYFCSSFEYLWFS